MTYVDINININSFQATSQGNLEILTREGKWCGNSPSKHTLERMLSYSLNNLRLLKSAMNLNNNLSSNYTKSKHQQADRFGDRF